MKNITINKKLIVLLFVIGVATFAFNAKNLINKFNVSNKKEAVAKPNIIKKQQKNSIINTTLSMNPQQDIIGTWFMENHHSYKIVFTNDNLYKIYFDNVLKWTYAYGFVDVLPNGNPIPAGEFLIQLTDLEDGDVSYDWVYSVGPNSGDYLTLISEDNGKMSIFIKQ